MEEQTRKSTAIADSAPPLLKDPHLIDPGSLAEGVQWLVQWALNVSAGAIVGKMAVEFLEGIKRRYGRRRLNELEKRIYGEIDSLVDVTGELKTGLKSHVKKLFNEFE
jgi:hypothetical protein